MVWWRKPHHDRAEPRTRQPSDFKQGRNQTALIRSTAGRRTRHDARLPWPVRMSSALDCSTRRWRVLAEAFPSILSNKPSLAEEATPPRELSSSPPPAYRCRTRAENGQRWTGAKGDAEAGGELNRPNRVLDHPRRTPAAFPTARTPPPPPPHFCRGTSAILLMSTSNPAELVPSPLLFFFSFFFL